MNTGTITTAKQDELVNVGERTFMRWLVKIDVNGTEVNSSVLRMENSPDPTGLQAEEKPDGNWKVAQQGNFSGGGGATGGGKDYKADPDKLRGENKRSCLWAAVNLAEQHKERNFTSEEVLAVAAKFYEWVEGPV